MTEKYDDSDSSWEFVRKDSSDSEDSIVNYRTRVRHDTGLPDPSSEDDQPTNEEKTRQEECGSTVTDSDIEVCIEEDDCSEVKPLKQTSQETPPGYSEVSLSTGKGMDHVDSSSSLEASSYNADTESDVERIEEEKFSDEMVNSIADAIADDEVTLEVTQESGIQSSSGSSADTWTMTSDESVTSIVENPASKEEDVAVEVNADETLVKLDESDIEEIPIKKPSDIGYEIVLKDSQSQTSLAKSDVSVSASVSTANVASETEVLPVSTNLFLLIAVGFTAMGIGFSIGAMYGPLHSSQSQHFTEYQPGFIHQGRSTVGETNDGRDNMAPLPLDGSVDLKTRLVQRTLTVSALKGRISKLRNENEKLKTQMDTANSKHMQDIQMQHHYKKLAMHQEYIASQIEQQLLAVKEVNRRKLEENKLKIKQAKKEISSAKKLYELSKKSESNSSLQALAIEVLYNVMHEKSQQVNELQQNLTENLVAANKKNFELYQEKQNAKANFSLYEAKLQELRKLLFDTVHLNNVENNANKEEILRLKKLLHLATQNLEVLKSNRKEKADPEIPSCPKPVESPEKPEVQIVVDETKENLRVKEEELHQCQVKVQEPASIVAEAEINKPDANSEKFKPPAIFVNVSANVLSDVLKLLDPSNYDQPFHHLFITAMQKKSSSHFSNANITVSYVPSVYFDHAIRMQGICRSRVNKQHRIAQFLQLLNRKTNAELKQNIQENTKLQNQLSVARQTSADLREKKSTLREKNKNLHDNLKQCRAKISQPSLKQCLNSMVNTTAIQPFLNITMAKKTVNMFVREVNNTAIKAWTKIVSAVRKYQDKYEHQTCHESEKYGPRLKGANDGKKKWFKRNSKKNPDDDDYDDIYKHNDDDDDDNHNKEHSGKYRQKHGKPYNPKRKKDNTDKARRKHKEYDDDVGDNYESKNYKKHDRKSSYKQGGGFFGKIGRTVKSVVGKGGKKIKETYKFVKAQAKEKKKDFKRFYQKNHPKDILHKAKRYGAVVYENVMNATKSIFPLPKVTWYCHDSTSDKGCSKTVDNVKPKQEEKKFETKKEENPVTDLWYFKRYEEREQQRQNNEKCEMDDWFLRRQIAREILRNEKESKFEDDVTSVHIEEEFDQNLEDDVFVDDLFVDEVYKKHHDVLDEMVNFHLPKDDEGFHFPNF